MEQLKPAQEKVVSFLKSSPQATIELIGEKTKFAKIVVINTLKQLQSLKLVELEEKEGKKYYSAASINSGKAAASKSEEEKPVAKKSSQKPARDLSTYRYGKLEDLNKTRYALEVAKGSFGKLTLTKLTEIFAPLNKKMSYGLFAPTAEAKKVSESRPRFILSDVIVLKSGQRVNVSNQWTKPLLDMFIELCNKSGIKTK